MVASSPVSPAAVREALRPHPTVGCVAVAADPEAAAEWTTLAELASEPEKWMARVAPRTGGDPPATAAFLVGWAARAVTGLPVAMLAASGRALVARPEHTRLRVAEGGWATGIAILGGAVIVEPQDELAELHGATVEPDARTRIWYAGGTLAALAAPIVDAVAPLGDLRRRVLWALVADQVAVTVLQSALDATAAAALIDELWGTLPARPRSRVALERGASPDAPLRAKRLSCCLAFRTPEPTPCADCPYLAPPSGRGLTSFLKPLP